MQFQFCGFRYKKGKNKQKYKSIKDLKEQKKINERKKKLNKH